MHYVSLSLPLALFLSQTIEASLWHCCAMEVELHLLARHEGNHWEASTPTSAVVEIYPRDFFKQLSVERVD